MDSSHDDLRRRRAAATLLDRVIRRFGPAAHLVAVLALYVIAASALGLAASVAVWFIALWDGLVSAFDGVWQWPVRSVGYGLAFFAAGLSLLLLLPVYNRVLPTRVEPYRGQYFSIASLPWCLHNGLFYVARYTFLPFVTLTPFGPWFLRAMGMKIGRRAFVNTELISDPCLVTLGNDVVIGGGVHLFAHYGGAGHLVIAPVTIGDRVTIGLGATVMGDVIIGADATVLPHSVLLPGSRVAAGETWGGVPAQPLSEAMQERMRAMRHGSHALTGINKPF
jgi:acetyltransferase-like isoleucine patch superfamily enzyme